MAVKNMAASILTRLPDISKNILGNRRSFYLTYPIFQTMSGKLTWSHYLELLSIEDNDKRSFYEKETENANWSVREQKGQLFPYNKKVNYFPAFLDELWERLYTKTVYVLIYEKIVFVERKQSYENL